MGDPTATAILSHIINICICIPTKYSFYMLKRVSPPKSFVIIVIFPCASIEVFCLMLRNMIAIILTFYLYAYDAPKS